MKYAFYPGCVSRGGCPELYPAAKLICERLGIELEEMPGASCTGAGVLQEKNRTLGDTLNARTFAMAENLGLPIMTICSTCQGVMSQANHRLKNDPEYLAIWKKSNTPVVPGDSKAAQADLDNYVKAYSKYTQAMRDALPK